MFGEPLVGALELPGGALADAHFAKSGELLALLVTVAVMLWLLDNPRVSGVFNVGTGVASSFKDMITALFAALGRGPNIEYIDMPLAIRDSYQYFTRASVDQLRQAGYSTPFTPIGVAVKSYVNSYLDRPDRYR